MGRHSGFFAGLCVVATLLAARFAAALNEATPPDDAQTPDISVASPETSGSNGSHRVRSFTVPPDSLIVLTSADRSGGRHTFKIHAKSSVSAPLARNLDHAELPNRSAMLCASSGVRGESIRMIGERDHFDSPAIHSSSTAIEPLGERRFLAPRYGSSGVAELMVTAQLIAADPKVALYIDMTLPADQRDNVLASAQHLSPSLVAGILKAVTERLGAIHDLDHDGRLAVLITELDCQDDAESVPVLGCVRPSDFLGTSSAEDKDSVLTDVVYLDDCLPSGNDLTALLAHELTHAAVYCRLHDRSLNQQRPLELPEWLHEGIAHHMEFLLAEKTLVYQDRLEQFQLAPHRSPICSNPDVSSRSERRGGSRAALSRFLQFAIRTDEDWCRWLSDAENVNQLLAFCFKNDLEVLLPAWSLHEAREIHWQNPVVIPELRPEETISREILGTAFAVLKSGDCPLIVEVHCLDNSPWDVSWTSIPTDTRLTELPLNDAKR